MRVEFDEPLNSYMHDSAVQSAVNLLLRPSSDKRVGLEESAPYADQAEYRSAWLAAREVYVGWHGLLSHIWEQVWLANHLWSEAKLTELSSLEVKAEDWELPTLHIAWNEEWFGRVFRTARGRLIGLYVYGDLSRTHLNFHAPEIQKQVEGWEPDNGEFDSIDVADWDEKGVDLAVLQEPVANLLQWLATE